MTWLMPLVVMLGSYLTITMIIYKRSRVFKSHISAGGLIGTAKAKTIKITGVLVIGFILCWTPYNAMYVW